LKETTNFPKNTNLTDEIVQDVDYKIDFLIKSVKDPKEMMSLISQYN